MLVSPRPCPSTGIPQMPPHPPTERFPNAGALVGVEGGLHLMEEEAKTHVGLESTSECQPRHSLPRCPWARLPFSLPLFPQLDNEGCALGQKFVTSWVTERFQNL